jgi:Flp pilus assembly protein TadD
MHRGTSIFTVITGGVLTVMLIGCAGSGSASRQTAALRPPEQGASADWHPEDVPNHLALARKLVRQEHYAVAMRQLADALKANGKDPEVHYLTGVCHRETGDLKSARTDFLKAIALDAGYAPAHNGLGITYFLMNRPDKAREALEKAISFNPANADYPNNLGVLDMRRDRLDAAKARFEQCLQLDAGHICCMNNMAECLVRMGRDSDAQALLQSHQSPATAYNNLGAVYMAIGRPGQARQMFFKALDQDPALPAASHNLNHMDDKESAQP